MGQKPDELQSRRLWFSEGGDPIHKLLDVRDRFERRLPHRAGRSLTGVLQPGAVRRQDRPELFVHNVGVSDAA